MSIGERGRQDREVEGIGWTDALDEINPELAKDPAIERDPNSRQPLSIRVYDDRPFLQRPCSCLGVVVVGDGE